MKKVTILYLGTTGAGPVYSLEMAKALVSLNQFELQIIIAEGVLNKSAWEEAFEGKVTLDVVKTYHHSQASVLLSFITFWRPLHVVKLINRFNPDILYLPFGLVWSPVIFPLLNKHISIIYTLHDPHPHDKSTNVLLRCYEYMVNKSRDKYSSGIVILNNVDKQYVEKNICSNVIVIPHASFGYYTRGIMSCTDVPCRKRIGFIGRIEPYKGLDLLLDAYQLIKHEGICLLIAGNGDIPESLMEMISSDEGITLINRYIEEEEFSMLLDEVDFVVLPYKRASQSGVIPMVFSYGKTVIATNVGALSEQVPIGTGAIVNPTAESIAKSIEEFYKKELYISYGKNALEYANTYLTWEYSVNCLKDFFNKNIGI